MRKTTFADQSRLNGFHTNLKNFKIFKLSWNISLSITGLKSPLSHNRNFDPLKRELSWSRDQLMQKAYSCYENQDKLQPFGPLACMFLYFAFTFLSK